MELSKYIFVNSRGNLVIIDTIFVQLIDGVAQTEYFPNHLYFKINWNITG